MPKPLIQYGKNGKLIINGVDWSGYVLRFTIHQDRETPLICELEFVCDFTHDGGETRQEMAASLRAILAELEK